jgi:hypothetical protein
VKDGRVIDLKASVDPPRPKVALIGKSVQPSPSSSDSNIALSNPDELPQDATLKFSVQSQIPAAFSHDETIEVPGTIFVHRAAVGAFPHTKTVCLYKHF